MPKVTKAQLKKKLAAAQSALKTQKRSHGSARGARVPRAGAGGGMLGDFSRTVRRCPPTLAYCTNDVERIPKDLLHRPGLDTTVPTVIQHSVETIPIILPAEDANNMAGTKALQITGGVDDNLFRYGVVNPLGAITWGSWNPWTTRLNTTFFEMYIANGGFVSGAYTGAYGEGVSGRQYMAMTRMATADDFNTLTVFQTNAGATRLGPTKDVGCPLPPRATDSATFHVVGTPATGNSNYPVFSWVVVGGQPGASYEFTVTQTYESTVHPVYEALFGDRTTMFNSAKKAEQASVNWSHASREASDIGPQPLGFFQRLMDGVTSATTAGVGLIGDARRAYHVTSAFGGMLRDAYGLYDSYGRRPPSVLRGGYRLEDA